MKNFKKITLSLFAAAALFSSCSKEDETSIVEEPVVVVPTADDFIVNTWMMTSAKATVPGIGEIDLFATFEECEKDDEMTFNADKSYSIAEGATKCSDTDPDISEAGTYMFIDSYSKLVMTETGETESDTLKIKSISATSIMIEDMEIDGDTGDTTIIEIGLSPKM